MFHIFLYVGVGLYFYGSLLLLCQMFLESVLLGIAGLFIPILSWFFVFTHWEEAKKPFLFQVAGIGVVLAGLILKRSILT